MLLALLLAVSCSKETAVSPASGEALQGDVQTFFATREVLSDSDNKAGFDNGIKWEVGDEIAVSDGKNQSVFAATAVDESGKATFTLKNGEAPLKTSGVTYKAWYPKDIAPDKSTGKMTRQQVTTNANGPIPAGKNINYSPSIYTSNPMYCESTTNSLSFKNLCGVLKITYDTGGYNFALHRILFESGSQPLWGEYSISSGKMVLSNSAAGYRRAELKNTNAKYVMMNSVQYVPTYYFAIPAGTYENLSFLSLSNSDSKDNFTTQLNSLMSGKALSVERNKVYSIKITLDDPRKDLSKHYWTANCYAVSSKGTYMFRATRGNETDLIPGIDHADILWRAQEWDSSNLKGKIVDNISYRNGYVFFNSDGSQGNALIAAYDSSNKILWSWHIWSLDLSRPLSDVTVNGTTFLDRNIGALYSSYYNSGSYTTSVLAAGYLYQWGRKDPFPGRGQEGSVGAIIKTFDKNDNQIGNSETSSYKKAVGPPTMAGPVSIATAIEHPCEFIILASGHWTGDSTDSWGGESKTIHDPCPYGYRVPASSDFVNWNTNYALPYEAASSATNTSTHGFTWTDGANSTFIPITGQLNCTTGRFGGGYLGTNSNATSGRIEAYGRIWTRDSDHKIFQMNQKCEKGTTWSERINTVSNFNLMSAYGMAVRCVKETTK